MGTHGRDQAPHEPQSEGAQGHHRASNTAITRGKASREGDETPGTSSGLTNKPQNFNTQESQGSEQRCRHRPEQERKINLEGPPGETRLHQDPRGDQVHQGPPLNTGAQGETKEVRTALGSAQGRDGTRHWGTNGALPQWQRGINRFIKIPEEEQDSPKPEGIKNKSPLGHESTCGPRVTQTQRRKGKGSSIG